MTRRRPCPFHLDCWEPCPIEARVHAEISLWNTRRRGERRFTAEARAACGAAATRTQGSRAMIKATMVAPKRGK
jgi:hypothetical protein